jgi:two-component SAPR family response regulator
MQGIYEFGEFRLETAERRLLRDGIPLPLPPKVFDTLVLLVENAGRLLSKDELIKGVWPDTFVEEMSLAQNISQLRKAAVRAPAMDLEANSNRFSFYSATLRCKRRNAISDASKTSEKRSMIDSESQWHAMRLEDVGI